MKAVGIIWGVITIAGIVASVVACGDAPIEGTSTKKTNNGADKNAPTTGGFGDTTDENGDVVPADNSGPSEVWGHSNTTLYKVDPTTKAVTVVGQFNGCNGDVWDIALDADSHLFGATIGALWSIDKTNASCTKIADGSYPNSLSFVPKGTVDPNVEALVGYEGGTYVRIDPKTGAKTSIGSIGGGLESSGDIVSVKDGATYLTVTGASCDDCLIEVNPSTGALVKNWGPVGRSSVYGLAFWAGKVYGFDAGGEVFEVSFDGGKLTTVSIPIPQASATLEFWGAGSTTSAPVSAQPK